MISESADFTHEDMKRIIADPRYHCGQCGGNLNIAWGGAYGVESWVLRCSKDIDHGTIEKGRKSQKERAQMATLRGEGYMDAAKSTDLMAMTETAMVERVGKAKFIKDLSAPEAKRLALACITYGFDPIMHELTIFEGNPFVSVDGRYRKAQETGLFMGVESRPATTEERKDWEIASEDKFFRAVVKKMVSGQICEFVGWGRVTAKEIEKANQYIPISTNPMRMAEKRAEVQALRKAFSIPLPSAEYIGAVPGTVEGEYELVPEPKQIEPVEEPAKKKAPAKAGAKKEEPVADAEIPGAEAEPEPEPAPEPPPERESAKDETPVTHAEGKEIERLFSHDGAFDPASMGEFCNAQRSWGIRQIINLKKWQYDIIVPALKKAG